MNINIRNYNPAQYLLEGGSIEGGAPMEEAPVQEAPEQTGGDPMQLLTMLLQEALQNQNCDAAMQVCAILAEQLGGSREAPATEPVYRAGGILVKRIARRK